MGEVLLVLAGDVMTGRGVDQVMVSPVPPRLEEEHVKDARTYVELAERVNGTIPSPVGAEWIWGDALDVMRRAGPSVRVMNLETSVTWSEERAPGKGIHYRMSPDNVACLRVAGVDVWALANNHVLDHGVPGLLETVDTLHESGLRVCGAGADRSAAWTPAVVDHPAGRVRVLSVAHGSSGVPAGWAAGGSRPGVALLPDLGDRTAEDVAERLAGAAAPGDVLVVSVHWGSNWGFRVPAEQVRFAHRLVDSGVDVIHGHSSHHPRPVEVYHDRPVLYGCGDLVDDYEGIRGCEGFRDDLRLLHMVRLDAEGRLLTLTAVPFQARRLRLWLAGREDTDWLVDTLAEPCQGFGTTVGRQLDGTLAFARDGTSRGDPAR